MRNIYVVPIDDRPCHNEYIINAMKHVDTVSLNFIPKEYLGHFMRGGDRDKLEAYLLEKCMNMDVLILSIDALLFGGLVQARSMEALPLEYYERQLQILTTLKQRNPNLVIYAYSVIMRLTTTVTDSKHLDVWENIFRYSQLVHQAELNPQFIAEMERVKEKIPKDKLDDYLFARKRNHEMNKLSIDLVKTGVIDYLVLCQEDTHAFGLHVAEQMYLQQHIDTEKLEKRVLIKNGTDEMVALLLARVLNTDKLAVYLESSYVDDDYVAVFEDKPIITNIKRAFEVANITLRNDFDANTPIFLALPAHGNTVDLAFMPLKEVAPITESQVVFYSRYAANPVAILDSQHGNGGDIRVLESVLSKIPFENVTGYSAWNTGSNAIGTLVLDQIIACIAKPNRDYIKLRIVDDALYQGIVRSKINEYMNGLGLDVWANNPMDVVDTEVTRLLKLESAKHICTQNVAFSACLPWGRSFEILLTKEESIHESI